MAVRDRKDILESIAANVAAARRKVNFTQERLAAESGVDIRTIQDMEGARYNVTIMTLLSVADTLQVEIGSLVKPAKRVPGTRGRPRTRL